ncbi:hypothetical protein NP233_g2474 [Leucocoprinus birnbaumii]|uniref:Nephrocystin 3-like N-terminal domain-containing protein n=1 Tax=Leucocoprinus birnbaumii TaxID=56174 RepID=A0AAD5VYD1_9AGAR|nr:hypothetical protein NP233_g2474 [Leucocoprinus birnbaumii]
MEESLQWITAQHRSLFQDISRDGVNRHPRLSFSSSLEDSEDAGFRNYDPEFQGPQLVSDDSGGDNGQAAGDSSRSSAGQVPPLREVIDRFEELGLDCLGKEMLSSSTAHILSGAHNFVMNSPVFNLNVGVTDYETEGMKRLVEHRLSGAEMDSFARAPPPRCHSGTRHTIRTSVTSWLVDRNRTSSLLWLHGAAGIGKSALAQTIAEYCQEKGETQDSWLGAALFLSRPNNRDDPMRIIPSLAYQLAIRFPAYRKITTSLITKEPSVLEKALSIQFMTLIVQPLSRLHTECKFSYPIVLLLDGLDECKGDHAQQTLIELIGSFSAIGHVLRLPFIWIIASRPEWQIVSAFAKVEKLGHLWKEELFIHSIEARNDVVSFLHHGFENIRTRYSDAFDSDTLWPSKDKFTVIRSFASGFFVFASTILDFIGDADVGDPELQLDLCLNFLKGTNMTLPGGPLDPLQSLYSGILGNIHQKLLPVTLQILSVLRFAKGAFSAQTIANFLCLSQASFYGSLRKLHAILVIPSPQDAGRVSLQVPLDQAYRSLKRTFVAPVFGGSDFAVQYCDIPELMEYGLVLTIDRVPWYHSRSFQSIVTLVGREIWPLVVRRAETHAAELYEDLTHFDFGSYDSVYSPFEPAYTLKGQSVNLALILCKLYSVQEYNRRITRRLIRLIPQNLLDNQLVTHYGCFLREGSLRPTDFNRIKAAPHHYSFLGLSDTLFVAHRRVREVREALLDPLATQFILGHGDKTCLVIAYRRNLSVKEFLVDSFREICSTYSDIIPAMWPLPQHVDLIESLSVLPPLSAGSERELRIQPSIIRSIVAFVADPQHSDPLERLNWIVQILTSSHYSRSEILNLLRRRVLDQIPNRLYSPITELLSFIMTRIAQGYDWSIPILLQDLTDAVSSDHAVLEDTLAIVNLLVSNRPLLFPLRTVLDFGVFDVPAYIIPSEVHYPWRFINRDQHESRERTLKVEKRS